MCLAAVLDLKARLLADCQPSCHRRVPVVADASDAGALRTALLGAGFDPSRPCILILEGFLGYLSTDAMAALLKALRALSAAGSRMIATGPPSPRYRERARTFHTTFEEIETTHERLRGCGWEGPVMTPAQLEQKYGLENHVKIFNLRPA